MIMKTQVYTSYFANVKNINLNKFHPIAISSKVPSGMTITEYKTLAPSNKLIGSYIRKEIDGAKYTEIYTEEILKKLNADNVFSDLKKLSEDKTPILICYEKPDSFCHRHLVSDWLAYAGYLCTEYVDKSIDISSLTNIADCAII